MTELTVEESIKHIAEGIVLLGETQDRCTEIVYYLTELIEKTNHDVMEEVYTNTERLSRLEKRFTTVEEDLRDANT